MRATLAARGDVEPGDPVLSRARSRCGLCAAPWRSTALRAFKASLLLAADEDGDVRIDLAERVGRLVPGLTDDQQAKVPGAPSIRS